MERPARPSHIVVADEKTARGAMLCGLLEHHQPQAAVIWVQNAQEVLPHAEQCVARGQDGVDLVVMVLPDETGPWLEALHALKINARTRSAEVVVVADERTPAHVLADAYTFKASAYVVLPPSNDGLRDLAVEVTQMWGGVGD